MILPLKQLFTRFLSVDSYCLDKVEQWRELSPPHLCQYYCLRGLGSVSSVLWVVVSIHWVALGTECFNIFFFSFLGLHPWHLEVSWLGVKSQQPWILTHLVRPGNKPISSGRLCWFLNPLSHNGNCFYNCCCYYYLVKACSSSMWDLSFRPEIEPSRGVKVPNFNH